MQRGTPPLADQVEARLEKAKRPDYSNDKDTKTVSTGSTLLDLAISGGRFEQGGIPGGILVEIFGPSGCGKTVLLCEIAGGVQRQGGEVLFRDPEGRLNAQFSQIFDFQVDNALYGMPDTVRELFGPIQEWKPKFNGINAAFADSLAALSTELEMDTGEDKMGMRRAKDFSEQCRQTCRILTRLNILMVCSNQVREDVNAGPYGERFKTPGGYAVPFYASLRLRCHSPSKITRAAKIAGKEQKRIVGVETQIDVYKSTVWEPHHSASVVILYDYGLDDIRANLKFIKATTGNSVYTLDDKKLGQSIEDAIEIVENDNLEVQLKKCTIGLWHEVEEKFKIRRVAKRRE